MDLLSSYQGVEGHQELFLPQPRLAPPTAGCNTYPRFIETEHAKSLLRLIGTYSYLDGLYRRSGHVGFKLMYSQLRAHPEVLLYLVSHRIRFIHLWRENHIDVLISEQLARLTGTSHIVAGQAVVARSVTLDTRTLLSRLTQLDRHVRQIRWLLRLSTCPTLEVTYEELLNGGSTFSRVLEFLNIAPSANTVSSNLVKRGTRTHRESIANYARVKEVLAPTPYSKLLR